MENENKNNDEKQNIEVVVGDSSNLSFSEVGDFMGDLRPQNIKGSRKNIIIPTNKIVDKENPENSSSDEKEKTNKEDAKNKEEIDTEGNKPKEEKNDEENNNDDNKEE